MAGYGSSILTIFKMLTPISLPDFDVNAFRFSNNGLRLHNLRDTGCNVWELLALVRKGVGDESSEPSEGVLAGVSEVKAVPIEDIPVITALPDTVKGHLVVCGNDHGKALLLYDFDDCEILGAM